MCGVQGVLLLSMAPDISTATRRKDFYEGKLRQGVKHWETCSNDGLAVFGDGKVFCECETRGRNKRVR